MYQLFVYRLLKWVSAAAFFRQSGALKHYHAGPAKNVGILCICCPQPGDGGHIRTTVRSGYRESVNWFTLLGTRSSHSDHKGSFCTLLA